MHCILHSWDFLSDILYMQYASDQNMITGERLESNNEGQDNVVVLFALSGY